MTNATPHTFCLKSTTTSYWPVLIWWWAKKKLHFWIHRIDASVRGQMKWFLDWRFTYHLYTVLTYWQIIITFCVSRRRQNVLWSRASVCLSAAVCPHYCTDPDVTWGRGRGCPLVVHYWADLQSGHGLRCYGNITQTLVTALRPSRDMTT